MLTGNSFQAEQSAFFSVCLCENNSPRSISQQYGGLKMEINLKINRPVLSRYYYRLRKNGRG